MQQLSKNGIPESVLNPYLEPHDFFLLPSTIKSQIWEFLLCLHHTGFHFPSEITCQIFSEVLFHFYEKIQNPKSRDEQIDFENWLQEKEEMDELNWLEEELMKP